MGKLGEIYWDEGRFPQAEALYVRALDIGRRVRGEEHPETLNILNGLGRVYRAEGKYPQAEALYTRALQLYRDWAKPERAAEWKAKLAARPQ